MSALASKVAVIGSGSWGTAFCGLLAPHCDSVSLWCRSAEVAAGINETHHNPRHLVDYELPTNVFATPSAAEALGESEAVILALPSSHLRSVCKDIAGCVPSDIPVLVLTKGLEDQSHLTMLDVAASELGNPDRMAALSGPNHAEEICRGQISAAVIASTNPEIAARLRELCVLPTFRVYVTDDVIGVEVCAAAKNVIAIACGVAAGLGAGDNTLAVVMTRGIAEISRLSVALGGNPLTPMGLAGMGDLVATCTSPHSRNRSFGEALVAGETLAAYEERTRMVVEGARAARSLSTLAHDLGIEAPLTEAVNGVLVDGLDLASARESLLGRLPKEEFYGIPSESNRKGNA